MPLRSRILVAALAALLLPLLGADGGSPRRFEFTYATRIADVPPGAGEVHVFVPVPRESAHQRLGSLEVDASIPGRIEIEPAYGNRFWHGRAPADGRPIEVTVRAVVERAVHHRDPQGGSGDGAGAAELAQFLGSNARVPVGHPILEPILAEIREASPDGDRPARARAIYDWVVDHVEYKKVGKGWGNGDTFWACTERYGNCTDFHSLFIALARTEQIPARFEMGFPVPEERGEGTIGGYHCWVEFHLEDAGWVPIDASEASKHPERRELFFGTQPADRVHFTTGRDLRLGPDHRGPALNYFVYPHVEVGGEPWKGTVERSFAWRDL